MLLNDENKIKELIQKLKVSKQLICPAKFKKHSYYELLMAKNGQPTIKASVHGQNKYIHSFVSPDKEANKSFIKAAIKPESTLILLGNGLGYLLKQILENNIGVYKILIVEKDPELFDLFLKTWGNAGEIDPRLCFFVDTTSSQIEQYLIKNDLIFYSHIHILVQHSITMLHPDYYRQVDSMLNFQKRENLSFQNTQVLFAKKIHQNIFENLKALENSLDIRVFRKQFKDKTAICLGAGPTLAENLPLLKRVKENSIIFCVDTALPILLKQDILPDIIFSLDYQESNIKYFENCFDKIDNIPIVGALQSESLIFKNHKGPRYFVGSDYYFDKQIGSQFIHLEFPGLFLNVTHFAYKVARYFGCSPVIFMGMDLCFVENGSYAGKDNPEKLDIEYINGHPHWIRGLDTNGLKKAIPIVQVRNYKGEQVQTTIPMAQYRDYMEKDILADTLSCYTVSEESARIQGIEVLKNHSEVFSQKIDKNILRANTQNLKCGSLHSYLNKESDELLSLVHTWQKKENTSSPNLSLMQKEVSKYPFYPIVQNFGFMEFFQFNKHYLQYVCGSKQELQDFCIEDLWLNMVSELVIDLKRYI